MCMPTNFGMRKKTTSSFKRTKKDKKQKDDFFCNCEQFLKENKKDENSSIKS